MKRIYTCFLSIVLPVFFLISCKENKEQVKAIIPEVNIVIVGQQTVPVYSEYVGETYG
jgi:hypothetical protein